MRKKILLVLIAIFTISILLTGCGGEDAGKEKALSYLQEKYKQEFDFKQSTDNISAHESRIYTFNPKDDPTLIFTVWMADITDDEANVQDSYVQVCVGRTLLEAGSKLTESDKNYYAYAVPSLIGNAGNDASITPEQFLEDNPEIDFAIYLFQDKEALSASEVYDALDEIVKTHPALTGSIVVVFTDAKTVTKVKEYFETHDPANAEYDDYSEPMIDISYSSGKLDMTKEDFLEQS